MGNAQRPEKNYGPRTTGVTDQSAAFDVTRYCRQHQTDVGIFSLCQHSHRCYLRRLMDTTIDRLDNQLHLETKPSEMTDKKRNG